MSTTAPELLDTFSTGWTKAVRQWADQSQTLWDQSQAFWAPLTAAPATAMSPPAAHPGHDPHGRHHHDHEHHHDHDHCHDDCECTCQCTDCRCCVPAADVVVHARIGERRVVPFQLTNRWRREHTVNLEVGPWHVCGGDGLVVTATMPEETLTLAPCQDAVVRLTIEVDLKGNSDGQDTTNVPGTPGAATCLSAYADVRFEGCARPQRVAVVVSPDHCDAIDVGCDCGCC